MWWSGGSGCAGQRIGEAVHVAQGPGEVEGAVEHLGAHRDLGIGLEHLAEGLPLLPRGAGVALDDAVGGVAAHAPGHQCEEHRLARRPGRTSPR